MANTLMTNYGESPDPLMTMQDVAIYLGLSLHTIATMSSNGRIPAYKIGNKWRYYKEEIDQWVRDGRAKGNLMGQ